MSNADELRAIRDENRLTNDDLAKLLGVSLFTIRSWLVHNGAGSHRIMGDRDIDYLRLKLKD